MRLVFDTCALMAFAQGRRMRQAAIDAIEAAQAAAMVFVPSIVALELAQKVASGKLSLGTNARSWFERAMTTFDFNEVEMSANMALAAYELPEPFHKDPADRLIVAIARLLKAPVVTIDRRILAYGRQGHVQVLSY
jgi:PIN domain nuclease of toxin-antitoxin system